MVNNINKKDLRCPCCGKLQFKFDENKSTDSFIEIVCSKCKKKLNVSIMNGRMVSVTEVIEKI